MPQIYRQFGIEDTLFWRGVSDDMAKHTDYNWRGDDGSVVFATQIPFGYYIGGNIPENDQESEEFWQNECLKKRVVVVLLDIFIFLTVLIKHRFVKICLI